MAAAGIGQIVSLVVPSLIVLAAFYDAKTKDLKPGLLPVLAQFPLLWVGLLATIVVVGRLRGESIRVLTVFRIAPRDTAYVLVGVALQFAGGIAYSLVGKADDAGQSAKDLIDNTRNNTPGFFALAILVGVGAPLVEELFYRGLVARSLERFFLVQQQLIRKSPNPQWIAVFISALWFALIHLQPLQFPLLFVVGLVCAWLTLSRARLGPAIFVHMGFNVTTVVALGIELLRK